MSNPRPRPKAMMLTQAAAERIKAIMAAKGTNVVGARIGVRRAVAPAWSTPWLGRTSRSRSTRWSRTGAPLSWSTQRLRSGCRRESTPIISEASHSARTSHAPCDFSKIYKKEQHVSIVAKRAEPHRTLPASQATELRGNYTTAPTKSRTADRRSRYPGLEARQIWRR
jgi:hypothetical protein